VLIATLPYSIVVSAAFAPGIIGILVLAVMSQQGKARRNRH
jgi:hypothetical protein